MRLQPPRALAGLLAAAFCLLAPGGAAESAVPLAGDWSAPSLSRPGTPILFTLHRDGTAAEQVGEYHGKGTWSTEGDSARIRWNSGWIGLLRPTAGGGYHLLTWKAGSPPDGPPDDVQAATRRGD